MEVDDSYVDDDYDDLHYSAEIPRASTNFEVLAEETMQEMLNARVNDIKSILGIKHKSIAIILLRHYKFVAPQQPDSPPDGTPRN